MTEPNSPNHWDLLASTLGASAPAEEPAAQQPSPAAPPPVHKPSHHERKTTPQVANWDLLASDLGLAPAAPPPVAPSTPTPTAARQAEPVEPIVPFTPKPDPLAALFGPLPERERHETPPPETPEESPNFFDERFDFEEPFDLLESSESAGSVEEAAVEGSESTEEKRPRRRRRRRRGRGRGGEQQRETEAASGERSDEAESELEAAPAEEKSEGTKERRPAREESEAGETGERRPRRRRSRRGRNRRDTEASPRLSGETARPDADVETDLESADLHDVGDDFEFGPEGDVEGEQPARLGFRGIPTWDEAVGLLIDKNIEARSKRPAGGPHHNGHGNRGQRDNRGGGRGGKH